MIPFTDLRSKAATNAEEVNRRKAEVQSLDKFDVLKAQKSNYYKEIKKNEEDIKGINTDIQAFQKKYGTVDVSSLEKDVQKRVNRNSEIEKEIGKLNATMKKGVDAFEGLYKARAALRERFTEVLDQLSRAKSDPSKFLGANPSEDDKKKLVDLIRIIEDEIQIQAKTHLDEENNAKKVKADYEALINTTAP